VEAAIVIYFFRTQTTLSCCPYISLF